MKHIKSFKVFEKSYYPLEFWDVNDYYHELKTKIEKISPSFIEFLNETYGEEYKILYRQDSTYKFDIQYKEFLEKISKMFDFEMSETKRKNMDRFKSSFGEILNDLKASNDDNIKDPLFYENLNSKKNLIYQDVENYLLQTKPHTSLK